MEQLQHAVQIMIWLNLAVLAVFGFLVFCWFCETVNKWIGDDGSEEKMRRAAGRRAQRPVIDRKATKEAAMQEAIREVVAVEVAKLTSGGST
jgi:hypothetical protein